MVYIILLLSFGNVKCMGFSRPLNQKLSERDRQTERERETERDERERERERERKAVLTVAWRGGSGILLGSGLITDLC